MAKTTVYNTFSFEPNLVMSTYEIKNAEHRESLKFIDNKIVRKNLSIIRGEVIKGQEIFDQILKNPDKLFLVKSYVFDELDLKNICKWDEDKKEADNSAYYGLIFK